MTRTPSSMLQAETTESGMAPSCISSSTSSTAVPSRFSTISIASMSPPASPIAVATRPNDPGTSGSSTRRRNGTRPTLGDPGDGQVSDGSGGGRAPQPLRQPGGPPRLGGDREADGCLGADDPQPLLGA